MSHRHSCIDCEFSAAGWDAEVVEDHCRQQPTHTIEDVDQDEDEHVNTFAERVFLQIAQSQPNVRPDDIKAVVVEGMWATYTPDSWHPAYLELHVGDLRLSLPPEHAHRLVEQMAAALVAYHDSDHSPTERTA
jgi:hypothetical protein